MTPQPQQTPGRLGDTAARDYVAKLRRFNEFAEPELRRLIGELGLTPGMRVLDAGCGSGEALSWFRDQLGRAEPKAGGGAESGAGIGGGTGSTVVGIDLAAAHATAARTHAPADVLVAQGDLRKLPFAPGSFDLIWSVNTINHVHDPRATVEYLSTLLRAGGRIAVGQSSLLADMIFAWDARLERLVTEAVRQYYRDRYSLDERDLTQIRALVGTMRGAGLMNVLARTVVIERVTPLKATDTGYLSEAIFRDTFGARLRPYLSDEDYAELTALCDPQSPRFALQRPDFHFLQTFTLVTGEVRR